jgi:molybdate transport system ATP-binding protein
VWVDVAAGTWVRPQQRRVGMVFQDYALFPHLTALQNLTIALRHLPVAERRRRAADLLALVHLTGLEDRRPGQLSGGQQQRVALARALVREPSVLLLDEPFAAVDQVTRRKLQSELAVLRRRLSIPIVLVTHDLQEAVALADRLVVLHRGRTLQAGTPAEVMLRPRTPLVARLVDQGNVFRGEVVEHGAKFTLLRWGDRVLEARLDTGFPPGAPVAWMIPPAHIVMHRRDRESRGERENAIAGRVAELVTLGESSQVTMAVDGRPGEPLTFSISTHAAGRNGLAAGAELTVSLLAAGIHLMPPEGQG